MEEAQVGKRKGGHTDLTSCNFIDVADISNFLFNDKRPDMNNLNIMHINCQSLSKNFDDILNLLHPISKQLKALAVTETWLKTNLHSLFNHGSAILAEALVYS